MSRFEKVSIDNSHFVNERNHAYSCPATSTWREHLQNSVDAIVAKNRYASGVISINIDELSDAVTRLEILDNGIGMDEHTIRDIFMKLGKTSKEANGSQSGGFGRARILTHFSQFKYHIFTHDLHVVGKGDSFAIKPSRHYENGCRMIIFVENKDRYGNKIPWLSRLTDYLADCQLPCQVVINGQSFTDWAHRRRSTKALDIGTVHANFSSPAHRKGRLLVRVNGTLMFAESIYGVDAQIILEITPSLSREVLTSNRDGFNSHFRQEWATYLNSVRLDAKGATEEHSNQITEIAGSGGFDQYGENTSIILSETFKQDFSTNTEHSSFPAQENVVAAIRNPLSEILAPTHLDEPHYSADSFALPSVIKNPGENLSIDAVPPHSVFTNPHLETVPNGQLTNPEDDYSPSETTERPKSQPISKTLRNRLFTIIVNDNTTCITDENSQKKTRSVISSYSPDSWRIIHREGLTPFISGKTKAKVILFWKTICHFVIEEYMKIGNKERITWGVGWLFSNENAELRQHKDRNWILLNPVNAAGNLRWSISDSDHLTQLIVLATHQIAHIDEPYHDKDFTTLQERLLVSVLRRRPEMKRTLAKISKLKLG